MSHKKAPRLQDVASFHY